MPAYALSVAGGDRGAADRDHGIDRDAAFHSPQQRLPQVADQPLERHNPLADAREAAISAIPTCPRHVLRIAPSIIAHFGPAAAIRDLTKGPGR